MLRALRAGIARPAGEAPEALVVDAPRLLLRLVLVGESGDPGWMALLLLRLAPTPPKLAFRSILAALGLYRDI